MISFIRIKDNKLGKLTLLCGLFLLIATSGLAAQEAVIQEAPQESSHEISIEGLPGLKERAVVIKIVSQIVEDDENVVWNSENSKLTLPGRSVGFRLVGTDLVIAAQLTPFLRPSGKHLLVIQGQIWITVPDEGIRYQTTMQTIPISFSEPVYFFPLGSKDEHGGPQIEILLTLEPYLAANPTERIVDLPPPPPPSRPAQASPEESSSPGKPDFSLPRPGKHRERVYSP